MNTQRILELLDYLDLEIQAAVEHHTRGKGGQQVPFTGDLGGANIPALSRLKWWSREFRKAVDIKTENEDIDDFIRNEVSIKIVNDAIDDFLGVKKV